jgi:hypothetical protein
MTNDECPVLRSSGFFTTMFDGGQITNSGNPSSLDTAEDGRMKILMSEFQIKSVVAGKVERIAQLGIWHSDLIHHSSFVIRHWPLG